LGIGPRQRSKVFWFFFSKKNILLSVYIEILEFLSGRTLRGGLGIIAWVKPGFHSSYNCWRSAKAQLQFNVGKTTSTDVAILRGRTCERRGSAPE
jgi:hypothetical protein